MIRMIFALAFASIAGMASDNSQVPQSPKIDPKFDVVPGPPFRQALPSDRDSRLKLDDNGRCYFIATRPVKPGPDQRMVRDIPSAPPLDNMPVIEPGPSCPAVR